MHCAITQTGRAVALAGSSCRAVYARRSRAVAVVRAQKQDVESVKTSGLKLYSVAPLYTLAATNIFYSSLKPAADYFSTLGLPQPLIQWGHPGNMAVVLLAMGMYGSGYLGWQIRLSNDDDTIVKAKELHPKLAIGMTLFFALGALGGMMSLIMQGKPIFGSAHVWTGLAGLGLLSFQGMLSLFFEDKASRDMHAYLGTAILALFVVHAGLGLQLGLSLNA